MSPPSREIDARRGDAQPRSLYGCTYFVVDVGDMLETQRSLVTSTVATSAYGTSSSRAPASARQFT